MLSFSWYFAFCILGELQTIDVDELLSLGAEEPTDQAEGYPVKEEKKTAVSAPKCTKKINSNDIMNAQFDALNLKKETLQLKKTKLKLEIELLKQQLIILEKKSA